MLREVMGQQALDMGLTLFASEDEILPGDYVKLALKVFPRGWSWAFWMIQRLHELTAQRCGFEADRRLTAGWAAPSFSSGARCLSYCDNLTVLGVNPEKVQEGIDMMTEAFSRMGFLLHEFTGVDKGCRVLGFEIGLASAGRAWVSGKHVQVLIGQFVSMAILARPALVIMRSLYDFVSSCGGRPRRLWESAAYEAVLMAGILPLIAVDPYAKWDGRLPATDACGSGFGACACDVEPAMAADMGRWSDR